MAARRRRDREGLRARLAAGRDLCRAALADTWIFKGGTCLRKCYYETYRFSEDLDFTVVDGGPEEPGRDDRDLHGISGWLVSRTGIEL